MLRRPLRFTLFPYTTLFRSTSARLKREVDELRSQLARLKAVPFKPAVEAPISTREDDLQKLRADDEAAHQALLSLEATRQRQTGENAELEARIRLLQRDR